MVGGKDGAESRRRSARPPRILAVLYPSVAQRTGQIGSVGPTCIKNFARDRPSRALLEVQTVDLRVMILGSPRLGPKNASFNSVRPRVHV